MNSLDVSLAVLLDFMILISALAEVGIFLAKVKSDLERVNLELNSIVESDKLIYNHVLGFAKFDYKKNSVIPGEIDREKILLSGFRCTREICERKNSTLTRVAFDGKRVVWIKV